MKKTYKTPLAPARSLPVVPSFWKEGLGVVEKNTVITYYIGLTLFVPLPPLTPRPPSRMGIRSPLWGRSHIDGCSKGPSRPGGGDYAGCPRWMLFSVFAILLFFSILRPESYQLETILPSGVMPATLTRMRVSLLLLKTVVRKQPSSSRRALGFQ